MRRVVASAAAILACVLGLTACDGGGTHAGSGGNGGKRSGILGNGDTQAGKDGGDQSAGRDADRGPGGGTGRDAGRTGSPLAGTDPCTLLKPADVPELDQHSDVTPTAEDGRCGGYDYSVSITEVDAEGYAVEFEGSLVKPLPDIAGYKAGTMQDVSGLKNCAVVLAVTTSELMTVAVMHDKDPSKTCDIAKKAAIIIAGRIPR